MGARSGRSRDRRRKESGASAVEFALITAVLFPLVFGIVEYGLWFNDSLNVRQGVREGARAGVVQNFDATGCSGNQMQKLACRTKKDIGAVTGPAYVKISAPQGWARAKPLVVCTMVKSEAFGIVPLPNDRLIRSRTEMSIEVATPVPTATSHTDTPPSGASWSWC